LDGESQGTDALNNLKNKAKNNLAELGDAITAAEDSDPTDSTVKVKRLQDALDS